MGLFYSNLTLFTSDEPRVHQAVRSAGRRAFVSVPRNGAIVVIDAAEEMLDAEPLLQLAIAYSRDVECAVLSAVIHDDSVLMLGLVEQGVVVDDYVSHPDNFGALGDDDEPLEQGGNAARLAAAFGVPDRAPLVERALRAPLQDDDDAEPIDFATELHAMIVEALGTSRASVGVDFSMLVSGEYPTGFASGDFALVE